MCLVLDASGSTIPVQAVTDMAGDKLQAHTERISDCLGDCSAPD